MAAFASTPDPPPPCQRSWKVGQHGNGVAAGPGRRRPKLRSSLEKATARGFEPLRAEPNGFRVHPLSRSDTLSSGNKYRS